MYYQWEIISNNSNLRKAWAIIKQYIDKMKTSRISDKFLHNTPLIGYSTGIAICFNNHFVNIHVGPTLTSKLPKKHFTQEFPPWKDNASLFLEPTDEVEITKIIRNLTECAPGQDWIAANNIKCITDYIEHLMYTVFN